MLAPAPVPRGQTPSGGSRIYKAHVHRHTRAHECKHVPNVMHTRTLMRTCAHVHAHGHTCGRTGEHFCAHSRTHAQPGRGLSAHVPWGLLARSAREGRPHLAFSIRTGQLGLPAQGHGLVSVSSHARPQQWASSRSGQGDSRPRGKVEVTRYQTTAQPEPPTTGPWPARPQAPSRGRRGLPAPVLLSLPCPAPGPHGATPQSPLFTRPGPEPSLWLMRYGEAG